MYQDFQNDTDTGLFLWCWVAHSFQISVIAVFSQNPQKQLQKIFQTLSINFRTKQIYIENFFYLETVQKHTVMLKFL